MLFLATQADSMDPTEQVRDFNRFWSRRIGLLSEHLPASALSLPQGRIVYELATGGEQTAATLVRTLDLDKGHLSRLIGNLRSRGLVDARADPAHAKRQLLSLTPDGRLAFAETDAGTRAQIGGLIGDLGPATQDRVLEAMAVIKGALADRPDDTPAPRLRAPRPGDMGHVIHRQAVIYNREYGWDWTYEALIARILGNFAQAFDPAQEDGWIADQRGAVVGSIFLMRGDVAGVAKLRLLYVEPAARGFGLGRSLVNRCIERARELGYSRLDLWTNDVLVSARRIYQGAGFDLVSQEAHHAFGRDLVGQTWSLAL
jgi:DNA-binding MarR family transcriptional regulator/GNAT superfamily N-acetyltransferase